MRADTLDTVKPPTLRPVRRATTAIAIGALVVLGTSGCAKDPTRAEPERIPAAPTSTATTDPAAAPTLIATAKQGVAQVVVHSSPAGPVERLDIEENGALRDVSIASPTEAKVRAVFLLKQRGLKAADGSLWDEVYLPVRPNGSTGWIADGDVEVTSTTLSIAISLGSHTLTLKKAGVVVKTYPVAVGTAQNPTPVGRYFVKELVSPDNPHGAYGPLAYGLSGHSPTIKDSAEFADGVIAVHGTDHPELIGQNVSHGCIRLKSEDVLDLRAQGIPLGTPVTIAA